MMKSIKYTLSGMVALATMFAGTSVIDATHYTVQDGDTLSKIAEEQDTTVEHIVELNKLQDVNFITIGQVLDLGEGNPEASAAKAEAAALANPENQVASPVAQVATTYAAPMATGSGYGVALANGNTAGETGRYAAARMAELTGVPAATWENIIARESNGDMAAANASGASGLFQTMPGWGSTATVDDQIAAAQRAYNAQGLSAWGY